MMLQRIDAVIYRNMRHFWRNWDRLADAMYWPVMDLLMWGLTTKWLQDAPSAPSNILLIMLTGIVFWQIVWRANYEISINFLEEVWSGNTINLFASPLRVVEWMAGVMTCGLLKVGIAIVVGWTASWFLFSLNILKVGYLLVPFLACLILFGWTLGFVATGLIVYFGKKIQTIAWMMGFVFAPFSAVYYPVEVLPSWAQVIARFVPTKYIFEGMREVLKTGEMHGSYLLTSFVLNGLYLFGAMLFFCHMFEKRRERGLQNLE